MGLLLIFLIIIVSSIGNISSKISAKISFLEAQRTCVQKVYPGAQKNIVCVCNSTYCDDFPPLGTLKANDVAVYTSSQEGDRFKKSVTQFSTSKH